MARRDGGNPYARPDHHTRAAKAAGYPARSVFKLSEIDRRVGLLHPGQHVLDLGAAPGSWSKYVLERIGQGGRLLAVDLDPIHTLLAPNAQVLQADVRELSPAVIGALAPYDVVLSDMAPRTSGSRTADAWRSFELFTVALDVAGQWLAPGGSFVGKLFMGEGFEEARAKARAAFDTVKLVRPETTRSMSHEIFVVGLDKKPTDAAPLADDAGPDS
jgi:23S rRNA (uridine2552-2'-O)-methyltransferase